jgi:hypothetical protein
MATNNVRRPSPLAAWMRGPERSSEVIICNQGQSEALRGQSEASRWPLSGPSAGPQRPSEVIVSSRRSSEASQRAVRGNQGQSVVIMSNRRAISSTQSHAEATQRSLRGHQRYSEALKSTQRRSDAIRRNQTHSKALSSTQRALSGPSEGTWTRDGHDDPDCQRHHWWRDAHLLRHRRAHLPVPFAADDPRSATLVLRVPVPQIGETPADLAATRNGNAEVKAFFASGQVRPIRVQSEVIRGHQGHSEGTQRPSGALSGHQRALRGQSAACRGLTRRSEGTQRRSQAIRGLSEAILGNHSQSAALSRTQWQSRGRRDPRRPRWPHRVLSVRRVRVACAPVRSTCRRRGARQSGARQSGARQSGARQSGATRSGARRKSRPPRQSGATRSGARRKSRPPSPAKMSSPSDSSCMQVLITTPTSISDRRPPRRSPPICTGPRTRCCCVMLSTRRILLWTLWIVPMRKAAPRLRSSLHFAASLATVTTSSPAVCCGCMRSRTCRRVAPREAVGKLHGLRRAHSSASCATPPARPWEAPPLPPLRSP